MIYKLKIAAVAAVVLLCLASRAWAEHGSLFGGNPDHILDFPHFANSAGIVSELVLVNRGSPTAPAIYFFDEKGELIESLVEMTESLSVMEDGGLTTAEELPTLGEITISTNGSGELVKGSVKVVSATLINGFLRFTMPQGVAGVASAKPTRKFIVPVQRQAGGINTGLAIHNTGEVTVNVDCTLMKDGEELETVDIELEANHQISKFIDELFDTENFMGLALCEASGPITGVALELDHESGALGRFTTLPLIAFPSADDLFCN